MVCKHGEKTRFIVQSFEDMEGYIHTLANIPSDDLAQVLWVNDGGHKQRYLSYGRWLLTMIPVLWMVVISKDTCPMDGGY